MKKITFILFVILLSTSFVSAAIYAKFDGVDGESKDSNHKKWIDVLSLKIDNSAPTEHDPGISIMQMTKQVGSSSPVLFEKCLKGTHATEGKMEVCEGKGRNQFCFLKIHMRDVGFQNDNFQIISKAGSHNGKGSEAWLDTYTWLNDGTRASETFTLNYAEVEFKYILPDGSEITSGPISFDGPVD